MKAEQARRREAEREWKAIEEAEHLRRKTKAYYRGEDLATADERGASRRSSAAARRSADGHAKVRKLRLDAVAGPDEAAEESEDEPSARSSEPRSKEAALAGGARRSGGRLPRGQDAHGERETARAEDASRTAPSKDEIAAALSKIRHRRYLAVKELLDGGRFDVETRDEFGNTLLMLAAQTGSKRMCKILLRQGASLAAQNWRGQTALHFCFAFRYNELGEYLKSKGADDTLLNHYNLDCYAGLEPVSPLSRSVTFAADTKGATPSPSSDNHSSPAPVPPSGARAEALKEGEDLAEELRRAQRELSSSSLDIHAGPLEAAAPQEQAPSSPPLMHSGDTSFNEGEHVAAAVAHGRGSVSAHEPWQPAYLTAHSGLAGGGVGVGEILSWPPSRGRSQPEHSSVGRLLASGDEGRTEAQSDEKRGGGAGGESGDGSAEGRETVVISAHEYQRLKALATPSASSVRVVGDKAVLLATEYHRLSETAGLMQGTMTPAARRGTGGGWAPGLGRGPGGGLNLSERARAAGQQPGGLRADDAQRGVRDTIEESPSKGPAEGGQETGDGPVNYLDSSRSGYSSGGGGSRWGGASDGLNISSDQSSPFSTLSKASPANSLRASSASRDGAHDSLQSPAFDASIRSIGSINTTPGSTPRRAHDAANASALPADELAHVHALDLRNVLDTLGEIAEGDEAGRGPDVPVMAMAAAEEAAPETTRHMPLPVVSPPSREAKPFMLLGQQGDTGDGRANDGSASWSTPGSLDWFLERRGLAGTEETEATHHKSWCSSNPGSLDWFLERRGVAQGV